MTLYVLCGTPASGKTTFSRKLAAEHNAKLHCYDSLPDSHAVGETKNVHEQMWMAIANDLQDGFDVVCDDLHIKKQWRLDILLELSEIDCEKILVVMNTSLEKCLRRNANRVARLPDFVIWDLHRKYEPPALDEGWDEIIYVKDDGTYETDFTSN